MRCRDTDQYSAFANSEVADAMDARHVRNAETLPRFREDPFAFLHGQSVVGFVVEGRHCAAAGMITDASLEGRECPGRRIVHLSTPFGDIYRFTRNGKHFNL